MTEKLFFFDVDGDIRKVSVPFLDSVSDLVPLLRSKFSDVNLSANPEFWTKDQKFEVKFQIGSPDDIYNGAVLEVVTHCEKTVDSNQKGVFRSNIGEAHHNNPYPHESGSYMAAGSGYSDGYHGPGANWSSSGFNEGPGEFHDSGPLQAVINQNGYGGVASSYQQHQQSGPETQNCSVHNKKRTLQNLMQQLDGT